MTKIERFIQDGPPSGPGTPAFEEWARRRGPVARLQGPRITPAREQQLLALIGRVEELERKLDDINNHDPLALPALKFKASDGEKVDVIRDEDDMASDDEDALATQQSIKAYIDGNSNAFLRNVVEDTTPQLGGTLDGQEQRIEDVTLNPYDVEYHDMGQSQASGVNGWAKLCTVTLPSTYDGITGIVPLIVDVDGFCMLSFSFRVSNAYNNVQDEDVEIYHYGADPTAGILSCCYTEKDTGSQYEFEIWIEIRGWRTVAGMPQWTLYESGATVEWDWNVTNEASKPAVGADYDAVTDVAFKMNLRSDLDMNDNDISAVKSLAFQDGGATVDIVRDEDDMSSDDAAALATQQSIKAYVDSNGGGNCYIETGTYTGDGTTNQTINLTDSSLVIKYIVIWNNAADSGRSPMYVTMDTFCDNDADGLCVILAQGVSDAVRDNRIKSIGTGNFHVDDDGSDSYPNKNGIVFNYMVIGTH